MVTAVLDGYNATVFAYGATGAGKTFTMIGTQNSPGVMVHTMEDIFTEMQSRNAELAYQLCISYLEVYNETIRDLLVPDPKPLNLREDTKGGMVISGLSEHTLMDAEQVFQLLADGNSRRSRSSTDANDESSRSHAVLQVIVRHRDTWTSANEVMRTGKLSLIDLAGSERAAESKNKGKLQKEGANINRSLLALGNCINALAKSRTAKFVPYRDSKLTRLLKDSLVSVQYVGCCL